MTASPHGHPVTRKTMNNEAQASPAGRHFRVSPTGLGPLRQKLLVLYAANSSPDTDVVAWSLYDGTSDQTYEATGEAVPPYATVLDAMRDGWRVIKYPDLRPPSPGQEYDLSYLEFEFVLEKLEPINGT